MSGPRQLAAGTEELDTPEFRGHQTRSVSICALSNATTFLAPSLESSELSCCCKQQLNSRFSRSERRETGDSQISLMHRQPTRREFFRDSL